MTVNEFTNQANDRIKSGWIIAALTDQYIVDVWPMKHDSISNKDEKILETRVFNMQGEMKLSRSDIGKVFSYRSVFDEDDNKEGRDYFDEIQYLDIDESAGKSSEGKVTTTGGGSYYLPVGNIKDAKIRIRYYLGEYERTGQARIEDWRVVEFAEEI